MKKILFLLMIGFLLIGVNLYAGDGDLIVDGKAGIGTETPSAKLDVLSSNISGLNVVTTKTGTGWLTGAKFTFTDTSSAQNLSGMEINYTHNGSVVANHVAESTVLNLVGSGTSTGDYGKVAHSSMLVFRGLPGTGYNYHTNPYAYAFALRAAISTNDNRTHYIRNIGGLQILHNYGNSNRTLSAENLYGIIVGDISQYGSNGLNVVTNAGGIQINKQTDSAGGRITNPLQGIWMNGDGAGADIVFGPNKETSIYSSLGRLYAQDSFGNQTILSPHDPETGEWIYYSRNTKTGVIKRVNMEELVKDVEKLTGKKYLIESLVEGK